MDEDDAEYEELVRILAPFREMRIETGPVELSDEYLRMIDEVESAPENQSGADKSWIEDSEREFLDYFARVREDNPD